MTLEEAFSALFHAAKAVTVSNCPQTWAALKAVVEQIEKESEKK